MRDRVPIRKLPSGVPGLDEVLGGGLPEFSFNLIAGGPGCGKTTLAHQIMFANATPRAARPLLHHPRRAAAQDAALPAAVLLLRRRQDRRRPIRFLHLGQEVLEGGLAKVLEAIVSEVEAIEPGLVVVDSFRAMVRDTLAGAGGEHAAADFVQRLALHADQLGGDDLPDRRVRRRRARQPGLHGGRRHHLAVPGHRPQLGRAQAAGDEDARPGADPRAAHGPHHRRGLQRLPAACSKPDGDRRRATRSSIGVQTGVPGLDEMLGGGIPRRLLGADRRPVRLGQDRARRTSSSSRASQQGENGRHRGVREAARASTCGPRRAARRSTTLVAAGKLEVLYLRPLDLSVDETLDGAAARP